MNHDVYGYNNCNSSNMNSTESFFKDFYIDSAVDTV